MNVHLLWQFTCTEAVKSFFGLFVLGVLVMQKFGLREGEILAWKSHQLSWHPLL